jgi:hypothetical protein
MLKGILDVKGLDDPGMFMSREIWLDWLLMYECSWKG